MDENIILGEGTRMKKYTALVLSLIFMLVLAGCGKTTGSGEPTAGGANTPDIEHNEAVEREQTQPAADDDEKWDMIPMVMVDGELYLTTGYESTVEGRCGVMDGEITSTVDGSEKPTENNQSNFGTGFGYQYGSQEGTIEIYMNEKWWIYATEEVRQELQFPTENTVSFHDKTFHKSDLSQETLEWLDWYNSLTEEEQLSINHIPFDLYELCEYPTAEVSEVHGSIE